jgi:DNA-binding PadR family transcriptional regulator
MFGWPSACGSHYNDYANRYDKRLARPVSVRHALLALLSEGPKYGLRLQQEFEERTGEVWPLNVGQVYITLQRLERDGLVESRDEREAGPQKRYTITPAGGAELDGWLRTPAGDIPPPRDELVIKVLISLRVPGADVHDIVQVHRRHMIELMQRYWRLKAEAAEDDIGLALVADAETFRLDGIVRWLDAADARLKLHPAPDPAGRPTTAGVPAPVRRTGRKVPR